MISISQHKADIKELFRNNLCRLHRLFLCLVLCCQDYQFLSLQMLVDDGNLVGIRFL